MIALARPFIGEDEKNAVLEVLDSGMLAQGAVVEKFEQAFAAYCGVKYAVAASSGTTALHLALLAHGIGSGDEVITSPFSFIATANAIRYSGATVIFADIEPDTFNLDPDEVEMKITPRTKAIMPVHLFGHPAAMDRFEDIARHYGLVLIEDACQAHGAMFQNQKVGSFGTGCFSFYPTKNITSAEGGMVTTNDPLIAEQVAILRNQGMKERYYHREIGYNFRMTDVHAAIGLTQLKRLEDFNQKRIANAAYLSKRLHKMVDCPPVRENTQHVFNQYTIRVPVDRSKLQVGLAAAGVGNAIYYPLPLHHQEPYVQLGYGDAHYPVTEAACQQVLSLPVHPQLTQLDLSKIVYELLGRGTHLLRNVPRF